MRTSITTTLLSLVLLASVGCDDASEPTTQERAADGSSPSSSPTLVAAPELPNPPTQAPAALAGAWQPWLDAEVARVQADAPAWFTHVMTLAPKQARAGSLRLVGPELEDPNAAAVLLHRYQTAGERPEVRAAVVAALAVTQGEYAPAIAELLATEPDPIVRVGMISSLRRASGPAAVTALELGFADADAQVRMNAAIVAGRHPDGASLAGPLIDALDDAVDVQLAAARSLGYLKVATAAPALVALLASEDPELRLASLQAIDRVDPSYAQALGQLTALTADADPTVARAAQTIADR